MMWTPATPGIAASSSISSTAMRSPSAAGSAACSSRAIKSSGMIVPIEALLHPARRFRRAQRRNADEQIKIRVALVLGKPRRVAADDRLRPCRTGSARTPRRPRPWPRACRAARRAADRSARRRRRERTARGPSTLRPEGSSPLSRRSRAIARQRGRIDVEHRLGLRLVAGLGIIAGKAQDVAHAAGSRAHEIRLQRHAGCGHGR